MSDEAVPSCVIYKGHKKADTYLYVEQADNFDRVPDALISLLGDLTHVMNLELGPDRKLANADIEEVKVSLSESGYFLQMPIDDPEGVVV